jgi:hypothetical protein
VSVYPVTMAELSSPAVQKYLESDVCEEVKMQFIRPSEDMRAWTGLVIHCYVLFTQELF